MTPGTSWGKLVGSPGGQMSDRSGAEGGIDGVQTKALRWHCDDRGRLMEILRADDALFGKFGQVYVTTAFPGVVKAWHAHERQDDCFACLAGRVKLVVYDGREGSPTKGAIREFFLGDHNPLLVRIPRRCHHGFQCLGTEEALVVNVVSEPYDPSDPDEQRLPPHGVIPYSWERRDR